MFNTFCKDYAYFQFKFKIFSTISALTNLIYYDDVLILTKPKLVSSINIHLSNSTSETKINNFAKEVVNSISDNTSKFDKKNKSNPYEGDINKSKKPKNKLNKNKRKNSDDIDNVKLLVNDGDDVFVQDLLTGPANKLRKINSKNKKRAKSKLGVLDHNKLLKDSIKSEKNLSLSDLDDSNKRFLLSQSLSIKELSTQISVPEAEIITYLFLDKGISVTINDVLDISMVRDIARNYGLDLIESSLAQEESIHKPQLLKSFPANIKRSPLLTILGHVDHGKTTLLDAILNTNLVSKESGGITQSISSYEVLYNYDSQDYNLIFLDTPGHESFKQMRLRGAKITDIVLLVIAIDDGLKPQTVEVINYIKEMSLSCIVVITKCDKLSNSTQRIKQDLASYSLLCEELGGDVPFVEVSALANKNIDILLSMICKLSDSKKLLANTQELASGTIIESYLDKKQGPVANIVIQNGTLNLGNIIVSDNLYGKVKSITNMSKVKIEYSGPSSIVQVLGFTTVPQAGSIFFVLPNEKDAKNYCLQQSSVKQIDIALKSLNTRISLNTLPNVKQLRLIIKTDTQGTLEAILDLLGNISQSKVQINILSASFGNISSTDVELALATNSVIVAFKVNILPQIDSLLKKYKINFKVFDVIYNLFEYIRNLMLDLIEPEYDKILIGNATVQMVFNMNKGYVAGCIVNEGRLNKDSYIHVLRNDLIVYEGFITSLKQAKNDVEEVLAINECGLMSDFKLWKDSDIIKVYKLLPKDKTL
uniref:Translation initiation factor IF-2, chloroplastic n=1 Tax=Dipterosiphonia australica TaxID=2007208 RepID=A0A1Z1MM37_9FLOR|nr:translation initiation factor 2 [Dipterosiphonia australica]ARW66834.1 translation initiation factor 2 [Dipterosiphonia australica]